MKRKNIDLSDIKENDLDKTSSFTDLMTRRERKNRELEKQNEIENISNSDNDGIENISNGDNDDIEEMVEERKRSTKDLTIELEKAKELYNDNISKEEDIEKTQILDLTRQMRLNFEEVKKENNDKKKNGISILNIIGEVNLVCIGYYIYLLAFTNYQDDRTNYMINGGIIVLLVLLFGISVVTSKKASKFFNVLNILAILAFIVFNAYTLLN